MPNYNHSNQYICEPKWFTALDSTEEGGDDVIAYNDGPHAVDLNISCIVKSGNIQFQIKNELGEWLTPSESSHTVTNDSLVRLPRANMPDIRILATADATFHVQGAL